VERIIKLIGLQDQAETFSKKLSGGQKRKLSVGIAIMGDPKVCSLQLLCGNLYVGWSARIASGICRITSWVEK